MARILLQMSDPDIGEHLMSQLKSYGHVVQLVKTEDEAQMELATKISERSYDSLLAETNNDRAFKKYAGYEINSSGALETESGLRVTVGLMSRHPIVMEYMVPHEESGYSPKGFPNIPFMPLPYKARELPEFVGRVLDVASRPRPRLDFANVAASKPAPK